MELSAQLVLAIRGAVMRRRRQEVLFNALNCPSRDRGETVSIPFESTKTRRYSDCIFICANGDFNSNCGVSIIIFRCKSSRCASNQSDGKAPSEADILRDSGLKDLSRFDASIRNSDTDMVDSKSFCVRPSLGQQSSSCVIYTQAV